jgi:serine/threonine protein kinase
MEDDKQFIGLKKVNNFILFKELGRGAFGEVYLSTDENLDELTAVKVINRKKLSPIQKNKLLIQLDVLSKLNHKNVTKILDKQKTSNNFYIEMEYSNGPNLYEYVKQYKKKYGKCLNEETVQKLVKQIASGLEYLHKNKIIHRDIKLENLIINFDDVSNKTKGLKEDDIYQKKIIYSSLPSKFSEIGDLLKENITVKICDFGFSRKVDENSQASTILGTPITTAPDVLFLELGQGHYGTEADMWSLGVCVYELLIGNVPFFKNSIKKLKEDILNGVFDYPKNVDISFESISFINALLQYDPKKRLSWDNFWKHPFLNKNVKDFHPLKLTLNLDKKLTEQLENFKVNSKNNNNFLWIVYKDGAEVGIELDKIDENFMKMKFNENYFLDGKDEDVEEIKDYTNYSFIDLSAKEQKNDVLDEGFEICNKYIEVAKNDWEVLSKNSEDDE